MNGSPLRLSPAVGVVAALLAASPASAAEWHVSPGGSPSGDGSAANPWDLATAFAQPVTVQPGDTIWLHGGTYGDGGNQPFACELDGTETAPIVVRQFPGERATIDGGIAANGEWTWFWGFSITNHGTQRNVQAEAGSPNARLGGINMVARGQRLINLVIHNTGHPAIGFWRPVGDGGEVYGCLIWGNGIYDPSFPPPGIRGNGTYSQNQDGWRTIADNISFRNFTEGLDASSDGTSWVNGFVFAGNVAFDNGWANLFTQTRNNPMERLRVLGNFTYRRWTDSRKSSAQFGYYNTIQHVDVVVRGNHFVMGSDDDRAFFLKHWRDIDVSGNTFVSRSTLAMWDAGTPPGSLRWDDNDYWYAGDGTPFILGDSVTGDAPATFLDWDGWRAATGFDAASRYHAAAPTGVEIYVRRNKYEPERAHVIVYNWDLRSGVDLDATGVLEPGQTYRFVDAQNYFGAPVAEGTYDGSPITLPMNLTEVSPILGDVTHYENLHTAPEFAVFVLTAGDALVPAADEEDVWNEDGWPPDSSPDASGDVPGGNGGGGCACAVPGGGGRGGECAWSIALLAATVAARRRRQG